MPTTSLNFIHTHLLHSKNPNPTNHHQTRKRFFIPLRARLSSSTHPPSRYAVLGAGFAGLSVAWHLLQLSSGGSSVSIDLIDEIGIGGGASGVSGGLIHPYSPKGRVLWKGAECWRECLKLLDVAEGAKNDHADQGQPNDIVEPIVWKRGILRPATTLKNAKILKENAQSYLDSCKIDYLEKDSAENLVPGLQVPFNSAIHMPLAVNIHPKRYLQALFSACKNLAADSSCGEKQINLLQKSVENLHELSGEYNAVIICLGAKVNMLPELSRKLPIRTCRGVVTHLQLFNNISEEYGLDSPSILSDAWIAAQGPRNVVVGSTWDWNSKNYSSTVSEEETTAALHELLTKASTVYPAIKKWNFVGATAGLRAMPPLTPIGSIPLMGCVDGIVGEKTKCKYWVIGGLGSRGLLYHGFLGKLMAQSLATSSEDVLPTELTSWKNSISLKRTP